MSLTNDTDVLGSSASTVVSNDLGLNFKMSDALSTRISYRTDYNSDPAAGRKSTDNTVGLSLVVGF
jgi:putative salt-induced outer membrane protein